MSDLPTMKKCPCGSGKQYKNCCQPIHIDHANAKKPEQLMRARYSAYVLNLVDFIIATYHPDCNAAEDRDGIVAGCELNWTKLAVKECSLASNTEGYVHFKAFFIEDGQSQCLEERSRFLKVNGLWFYVDGEFV